MDHGELDQSILSGPIPQLFYGAPVVNHSRSDLDRRAIFLNDTITINNWSVTPGVRLDYNSVADSFFSPSLGIAYNYKDSTIFRGTCARGFNYPYLSFLSGGGFFSGSKSGSGFLKGYGHTSWGLKPSKFPTCGFGPTCFFHDQEKNHKTGTFWGRAA